MTQNQALVSYTDSSYHLIETRYSAKELPHLCTFNFPNIMATSEMV